MTTVTRFEENFKENIVLGVNLYTSNVCANKTTVFTCVKCGNSIVLHYSFQESCPLCDHIE